MLREVIKAEIVVGERDARRSEIVSRPEHSDRSTLAEEPVQTIYQSESCEDSRKM